MSTAKTPNRQVFRLNIFFKDPLPYRANLYILLVILLGLPVAFVSLYRSFTGADLRWLYLAGLTLVSSVFAIKIPLRKGQAQSLSLTVSDVFIFAALLLFGPFVAATVAVVEALASGIRVKVKRLYKQLFNLSQLALVAFIVGQAFYGLAGGSAPLNMAQAGRFPELLVKLAFCGLIYFVLNSGLVGLAMALVTSQSFLELWRRNFFWLSLANVVNESTAAIVVLFFKQTSVLILLAIVPMLLVLAYVRQVQQRQLGLQD